MYFVFAISFAQKKVSGTWISGTDKKYSIVLTDSTWIDKYENKIIETRKLFIIKDTLITISKDNDTLKYDLMNYTKKILSLMYLGRGNILEFRRK